MATIIMSAILFGIKYYSNLLLPDNTVFLAIKLGCYSFISPFIFFGLCILFRINEANQILDKIKSKIFKNQATEIVTFED